MLHFPVTYAAVHLCFPSFPVAALFALLHSNLPAEGGFPGHCLTFPRFQVIIPLADALKEVPRDRNHGAKASKPCPSLLPLTELPGGLANVPAPSRLARPLLLSYFPGGDRSHAGPVLLPLASHKRILEALESAEQ